MVRLKIIIVSSNIEEVRVDLNPDCFDAEILILEKASSKEALGKRLNEIFSSNPNQPVVVVWERLSILIQQVKFVEYIHKIQLTGKDVVYLNSGHFSDKSDDEGLPGTSLVITKGDGLLSSSAFINGKKGMDEYLENLGSGPSGFCTFPSLIVSCHDLFRPVKKVEDDKIPILPIIILIVLLIIFTWICPILFAWVLILACLLVFQVIPVGAH